MKQFEERTTMGELRGFISCEAIPFDPEGRIHRTPRYSHLPPRAFGDGCSSKLNLETTLAAPFEIDVKYLDPTCTIHRLFIYRRVENSSQFDWDIYTITDPTYV